MLTRSKAQEKDRKLVVENTTIELKPVSVCLHRDEIDKFYVSNDCKSEYYAVGVGVAQPTVLVDAVSGNFNNGDCDTIIQTSSGPFIQSECNGTVQRIATDEHFAHGPRFVEHLTASIEPKQNYWRLYKRFNFKVRSMKNRHQMNECQNIGWRVSSINEIVPWVPTFSYLMP